MLSNQGVYCQIQLKFDGDPEMEFLKLEYTEKLLADGWTLLSCYEKVELRFPIVCETWMKTER